MKKLNDNIFGHRFENNYYYSVGIGLNVLKSILFVKNCTVYLRHFWASIFDFNNASSFSQNHFETRAFALLFPCT